MRDDACLIGPEPGGDEVLVLPCGEVDEPVDPSAKPEKVSGPDVMDKKLGRVACLGCLPGGEQPLLSSRGLEEAVPVGARLRGALNARKLR